MNSVTLFEMEDDDNSRYIGARLQEGSLIIEGHDLGKKVGSFWGATEYEYYYSLSEEDTNKLSNLLQEENSKVDLLSLIIHRFSGNDACNKLKRFCKTHNLSLEFFSYY